MPMISFIIPTLNEEEGIGKVLEAIKRIEGKIERRGFATEVVIVDGGSRDRTVEIAKKMGARVIVERRKGYGRAYKTGFEHAKGDIFITLDGDGTYPVDEVPGLLDTFISNNLDFLTTNRFYRMEKGAMSLRNRIGNAILTLFTNLLFSMNLKDSQSGMWLLRREAWEKMRNWVKSDGMAFSQEMKIAAKLLGLRFMEVGISYRKRKGEVKLMAWKDGVGNLLALFQRRLGM